jgi:hypothetical protein
VRKRTILAALVCAVAASALPAVLHAGAAAKTSFVTRAGNDLMLNGQRFLFTGMNVYNANSDGWCWWQLNTGPALGNAMTAMGPGVQVMRSWFFQRMATTNGQRDWSGFDHTLAVAKAHGIRVIATLANQWPDCEPASGYKDEAWYTTGYTQPDPSGTVSYRSWVAEVAARYKNDPTIMAWQLINEAEVKPYAGSGSCSTYAKGILVNWATDVSGVIKAADPNHLVSLGTIGTGQCGASGPEYYDVHNIPTIDICEYHDYGSPSTPLPGDQWNGLLNRISICNGLDKPMIIGESGINPSDVGGYQGRAAAFKAKFEQEFGAGVDGIIPWAWDINGSTPNDYDIGPGDPLLGVMASATQPDHTCRGPKLVVAAGVNCNITGWTFSSVTVKPGGALRLYSSAVTGTLSANGAAAIDLDTSSLGTVQITNSLAAGTARLCGVTASDATLKGNAAPLTIGGPGCEGQFRSLSVTQNTGGVTIQGNTIARMLACTKNVPAPAGGGNTAATKTGQCAAL